MCTDDQQSTTTSSFTPARTEPSEITIQETNPERLADQIVEKYHIVNWDDFDRVTSEDNNVVRSLVEKLTAAQLGELLCTERMCSDSAYEWLHQHDHQQNENPYMVLKNWAEYVIMMCITDRSTFD